MSGDGDHADELAVEHVARGQPGDRPDLLGVERLPSEQAALELEHVARCAAKSLIALAATAASPRTKVSAVGPSSSSLQRLGARLVGGPLGQRVLDDAEGGVGLAQLRAQLGRLRARRSRGSPRRRPPRRPGLAGDLVDRLRFLFSVHRSLSLKETPARRRASNGRTEVGSRSACPGLLGSAPPGVSGDARVSVYAAARPPPPRRGRACATGSTLTPGPIVVVRVIERR